MKTKLQLTIPWMMAIMLLFSFNSHGQGFENFDNLDLSGTSYQDGTFEGQDGSTWTYVQCRGDHEIDGNAIMLGRNRDPQSNFYSGTIPGGVGVISFDYMQAFSTDVNMNVLINDVVVGNVTSDDEQGVVKSSGDFVVNQSGDIVIKFINETNDDGQVVVDNVEWTSYDGPVPPAINNVTQTPEAEITSDVSVSVSADITEGDAAVDHVELHWGTESDVYNNTINMSLDNDVSYVTDEDIPAQEDGTTVYYVVYAEGSDGTSATSMEYSYTVIDPAVTDLPFEESFDEDLGDLYTYSVSGDTKYWIHDMYEDDGYAYMNGYNSGDIEDDWLIIPGIEMENYTDVVLTFETAYNFGVMDDDNFLKLFYSEDYAGTGDPSDATWVELDFDIPGEGGYEWTPSGDVAIPDSDNTVYIGFQYYYNPGEYRAWQVDNIHVAVDDEDADTYEVTFDVIDEAGDPIPDAIVTLDGVTYDAGQYVIEEVEEGTYAYMVEKEGYHTAEGDVTVEEDTTVEVTLTEDVPEEVATLAELRDKPDDGTIYQYTGEAVIVAMDDHRNRKFLQD
ncbi:MAG: choice-of-anchor J domain-containing protein, partial [Bacteroidota bacterium]